MHALEPLRAAVAYAGRRGSAAELAFDERELALTPDEPLLVGEPVASRRWCYAGNGDAGWVREEDLSRIEDAPRFVLRPMTAADDADVAAIIQGVMPEFGADGPGFAIHDAEVTAMHAAYQRSGAAYFVIEKDGAVLGGGGVAPLDGEAGVCELRKMYFRPALRGLGAGTALIGRCLQAARGLRYRQCYLETLTGMDAAQALYERAGFQQVERAMGATGHFSCNRFYLRSL